MKLKNIYLLLFILGTVLPYSFIIPFLLDRGLDIPFFINQLFGNRISAFFGLDVIISAVVLLIFIMIEGKRKNIRRLWLPIAATLGIGVSAGLPLFLHMKEKQLAN